MKVCSFFVCSTEDVTFSVRSGIKSLKKTPHDYHDVIAQHENDLGKVSPVSVAVHPQLSWHPQLQRFLCLDPGLPSSKRPMRHCWSCSLLPPTGWFQGRSSSRSWSLVSSSNVLVTIFRLRWLMGVLANPTSDTKYTILGTAYEEQTNFCC